MMEQIGFAVVGLALLFSATRVVSSDNLVRSVLWLTLTLCSTAVLFVMLSAPFIASIQIILYTGGVVTLMLFGVMLTNREAGVLIANERSTSARAAIVATASFCIITAALFASEDALPVRAQDATQVTTAALGVSFLTEHLLAFEVLSVLLLVAMIGAIVLARRTDFGDSDFGDEDEPRVGGRPEPEPPAEPSRSEEEE